MKTSSEHQKLVEQRCVSNYAPLPVVIQRAEGSWVWDVEGRRYLDMLSAYSALNFGHAHPRLLRVAHEQLELLTMTSRAFLNDKLGPFCRDISDLCGKEVALPMNTGVEAVESAIKVARKWGYEKKGVEAGKAKVICFENNFHGRTLAVLSFSSTTKYRHNFDPFCPGFTLVPYGDLKKLEAEIDANTVAVLLEPIQGEGGIIVPPDGFLRQVRDLCTKNKVLLLADEIQTGLCRTGKVFCVQHEEVVPDLYILGKALAGGIVPLSAVVGDREVLGVLTPGTHGSTFSGNPLACALGIETIAIINEEKPELRAAELGEYFVDQIRKIPTRKISAIRGRGLMVGVDIHSQFGPAKSFCKRLKDEGVLCSDTREQTIRFVPPLVTSKEDLDWGLDRIRVVFRDS